MSRFERSSCGCLQKNYKTHRLDSIKVDVHFSPLSFQPTIWYLNATSWNVTSGNVCQLNYILHRVKYIFPRFWWNRTCCFVKHTRSMLDATRRITQDVMYISFVKQQHV